MLRGDLAMTRLDEVLRLLADDQATGRLALSEGGAGAHGRTAEIYVAKGDVYAAWLTGPDGDPVLEADARLRLRLLAEDVLAEGAWDDAVAAQEELLDWSLGELLVELGHLERAWFEQVATEELLDAVAQTSGWCFGSYRFRRRERTRNRAGRTYGVPELLETVTQRNAERERLDVPVTAVPTLGERTADAVGLEAAVLGLVDGVRSMAQIEVACGCTGLELAVMLRALADRGQVVLPAPAVEESLAVSEPVGTDEQDPLTRWSALLDATLPPAVPEEEPQTTIELIRSDLPPRPVEDLDPETAQRRARLRARAAEELLAAQVEVEALREAEAARAALAEELSVIESLTVIESAEEPERTDPVDVPAASNAAEPVDAAEPVGAIDLVDVVEVDDVAAMPDVVEPLELPVEVVETTGTIEEPDTSATSEASVDSPVGPTVDLVAEELLDADVPLAQVAAEAAPPEPSEPSEPSDQSAVAESDEPVADPVADFAAEPDIPDEPADEHDPALAAALLRELSSLGVDDEPAPTRTTTATRAPRVPGPRHAAAPSRKKRGIFGR